MSGPVRKGRFRHELAAVPEEDRPMVDGLVANVRRGECDYSCCGGYVAMGVYDENRLVNVMVSRVLVELEA